MLKSNPYRLKCKSLDYQGCEDYASESEKRKKVFFATWCQSCKAIHHILEQVKSVLGDRIRIIKVDVDKYSVTAGQYRIQSVPTLMLFRNGEVLWHTSGVTDKP